MEKTWLVRRVNGSGFFIVQKLVSSFYFLLIFNFLYHLTLLFSAWWYPVRCALTTKQTSSACPLRQRRAQMQKGWKRGRHRFDSSTGGRAQRTPTASIHQSPAKAETTTFLIGGNITHTTQ
jgi:hypothetical protein